MHTVLNLAVGERTDISLNIRIDDGLTNGAANIVKLIQLQQTGKPSGIIWVQFDCVDIGEKTRYDNRHLYVQGIEPSWTPIKPVTSQFAVGKNRTVQVIRKQFPLRPAGAKTIHRSQGDTVPKIVVNFDTKKNNTSYSLCRFKQEQYETIEKQILLMINHSSEKLAN